MTDAEAAATCTGRLRSKRIAEGTYAWFTPGLTPGLRLIYTRRRPARVVGVPEGELYWGDRRRVQQQQPARELHPCRSAGIYARSSPIYTWFTPDLHLSTAAAARS